MTPAIKLLEKKSIAYRVHSYEHSQSANSYGEEAVDALGVSSTQVFKTLVAQLCTGELAVAVIPVSAMLNLKALAIACQAKKAAMANPADVERVTGYVLGGVSPLGQTKQLETVIDTSSHDLPSVFVSAGRRGLEIELSPADLAQLCRARFANIQQ